MSPPPTGIQLCHMRDEYRHRRCTLGIKERTKTDLAIFFQGMYMDHLSDVEALAINMNESYNALISVNTTHTKIV